MSKTTPPIGELLRAARNRQGLTLQAVADRAGLNMVQLAQLETGVRKDPRVSTVQKICRAIGDAELQDAVNAYFFGTSAGSKKSSRKAV